MARFDKSREVRIVGVVILDEDALVLEADDCDAVAVVFSE